MKLKLQNNLIIFKISSEEKTLLQKPGQFITQNISLPNEDSLVYTLSLLSNDKYESFTCKNNEIVLHIPCNKFAKILESKKKDITLNFKLLTVKVEVDLFTMRKQ